MGLVGDVARTAVVAGTWTAVSNRVSRLQAGRWAAEDQSRPPRQRTQYMPPPPGRYQRPMFQPARQQPAAAPAPMPAPAPAPADQVTPPGPDAMSTRLRQLRDLGALKAQGILTEEEFLRQKRMILNKEDVS